MGEQIGPGKITSLCTASKVAWDAGDQDEASRCFLLAQAIAGDEKLSQRGDGHVTQVVNGVEVVLSEGAP